MAEHSKTYRNRWEQLHLFKYSKRLKKALTVPSKVIHRCICCKKQAVEKPGKCPQCQKASS